MRLVVLATTLIVSTSLGCNSDGVLAPPRGLEHAAAGRSCAPTDGPAVTIYLSPSAVSSPYPTPPFVELSLWRSSDELVGRWSLAASSKHGAASRIGPGGEFLESAGLGSVTVLSVQEDTTIRGNVDIIFASGYRVRGGFTAAWISRTTICG